MAAVDFGIPPAGKLEVFPTAGEVAFFREHGYLVVERITTDEEIAWLREVFEHIFSPEGAGQPGAPVDRSGTLAPGEPSLLSQAFFPELHYPALLDTLHRRNARRYASAKVVAMLSSEEAARRLRADVAEQLERGEVLEIWGWPKDAFQTWMRALTAGDQAFLVGETAGRSLNLVLNETPIDAELVKF